MNYINKVYFNLEDYINESFRLYKGIKESSDQVDKLIKLKYLLNFYLKCFDDEVIGRKKLAYDICGLHLSELGVERTAALDEILSRSCEFELPDHHIANNAKMDFNNWLIKLRNYINS